MKKLLLLLTIILISCSSKETEVDNIEFMAYNWNLETPINKEKPKFKIDCEIYSIINPNGENKTYTSHYEPNRIEKYFESKIDEKNIDSLIYSFDKLAKESKSQIKYDSNIGCISSPPILKVKINYKDKSSKSYYYNFTENSKDYSTIISLYKNLRMTEIEENYRKVNMNTELTNKKAEFINYIMKADTLSFTKPKKINFEPQG